MGDQVHSNWLRRLPLFKEAKLSPNFYLTVSLELEVHLFAPLESIIQQHQVADCIFVVEKGIILARAPKAVKTAGHAFGEDSISAYRCDPALFERAVSCLSCAGQSNLPSQMNCFVFFSCLSAKLFVDPRYW